MVGGTVESDTSQFTQRGEGQAGAAAAAIGTPTATSVLLYLRESFRLRGAQRLIGQLQQLLRALQGFGAGAQLTLERERGGGGKKFMQLLHVIPFWNNGSSVLRLQTQ